MGSRDDSVAISPPRPRRRLLLQIYRQLFRHFGPQHWWPAKTPFEMAVGAILTQHTSWQNVERAIQRLKAAHVLRPEAIGRLSLRRLAQLIRPSGYFTVKARRLAAFVRMLRQHTAVLPQALERLLSADTATARGILLSASGVGPETADSILLYAGGHPVFVVDAYTRRIFSRHGLVSQEADYQTLQHLFMVHLPRDASLYNEYHALLVRVGKDFCHRVPHCEGCPLYALLGPPTTYP